jgi:SAM-dependent methyltransferase
MSALHDEALSLVADGDLVLDIGAGSGTFTTAAIDRGAVVVAVEASPRRAAALTASLRGAPIRVLNQLVTCDGSPSWRFVGREGVRRAAITAADDAISVATVSVRELLERFEPRLVRFRATGQEHERLLDLPAVLLETDALIGVFPWPDHATDIRGELRSFAASQPIFRSRHSGLFGGSFEIGRNVSATADEIEWCAAIEADAREPRRRARLAALLATLRPLSPGLTAVADRLAIDPADAVVEAMAWHLGALAHLAPSFRIDRRLASFNQLVDGLSLAVDGEERPSVLSLPL